MGLESLKYWHWMMIGVLIGLGFGVKRAYFWEPVPDGGAPTFDRRQFERGLAQGMEVRSLVLHPPVDGQEWVTGEVKQYVRGSYIRPRPGRPALESDFSWTRLPLLAAEKDSIRESYKTMNGREYLASLQKSHPTSEALADYRFAWWEVSNVTLALYAGAGFVAIGVIWPTIIALLCGAGFVKRSPKDEYDLSRFDGGKQPTDETKAAITEADQERLAELNAKLEAVGTANAGGLVEPNVVGDAKGTATVPHRGTTPLDETDAGANQPAVPKEYQGEFYPVAKPQSHKDERA